MRAPTILCLAATLALGACETHIVVDQPKPLQVNVNLSGQVDIVIHDARQNLEQITGEKAANVVSPADIGLPAKPPGAAQSSSLAPLEAVVPPGQNPVLYLSAVPRPQALAPATEDDLKKSMAKRSADVRKLWDAGVVGEAHDGTLSLRGALSADQKTLVDAENSDRNALYAAEAKRKGVAVDSVALSYYLARLGYAKKDYWYEKYNQTTKLWEWKKWQNP